MSPASWRRGIAELQDAGLVVYRWSTVGFAAMIRPRQRFTAVPHFPDERMAHLSPRAAKTLLAVARRADNKTRTVRMRLATVARAMGRSVRTVQLGLAELRKAGVIETHQTGRALWMVVLTGLSDAVDRFAPTIAPRSRLLLRLLSSSTRDELLGALRALQRPGLAAALRQLGADDDAPTFNIAKRQCKARLRAHGLTAQQAEEVVVVCGADAVDDLLPRSGGRRADRLVWWLRNATERRWALTRSTP